MPLGGYRGACGTGKYSIIRPGRSLRERCLYAVGGTLHPNLKYTVLRIVFRETMVIQMKNQSVDIKVLLHQNIQCINILTQAPDTQYVGYVCMTMSRSKTTYNQFYNC